MVTDVFKLPMNLGGKKGDTSTFPIAETILAMMGEHLVNSGAGYF